VVYFDSLSDSVARAPLNRSRLIILANRQAKNIDYPLINVNQELSELLVSFSKKERVKSVKQLVDQLVMSTTGDVVLLSGLEVLFDRSLAMDPIRLLESCAKIKLS